MRIGSQIPFAMAAGALALAVLFVLGQGSCASDFRSVSDPFQLTVTDGFTIAVIPDTQCYTAEGRGAAQNSCGGPHSRITNEMFLAMVRYIAANRDNARIAAVVGLGDIVECGDELSEWENAKRAYDIIDATDLPYAPVIGNHDYDGACGAPAGRPTGNYNLYFGPSRFAGKSWYRGHFPANSNENFFLRFTVDGEEYLVLALEWVPRNSTVAWAEQVIQSQGSSNVLVTTHEHLNQAGAHSVKSGGDNDGLRLWQNLLRKHQNIVAVLSGHSTTVRRIDLGDSGNLVPQLQSNYQHEEAGGSGYMRLLHFQPALKKITVVTYSPFLQRRRLDTDNDFTVQYGIP